jgi:hypothetical protein
MRNDIAYSQFSPRPIRSQWQYWAVLVLVWAIAAAIASAKTENFSTSASGSEITGTVRFPRASASTDLVTLMSRPRLPQIDVSLTRIGAMGAAAGPITGGWTWILIYGRDSNPSDLASLRIVQRAPI